jgi:hypothetical protein
MKAWIALAMVLCACREHRPPAPTEEQSAQLNEAENMLDWEAANEKGPEANASGPSNSSD